MVQLVVVTILTVLLGTLIAKIEATKSSETLDPGGKFRVTWEVVEKLKIIVFETTVETNGYIGFGISNSGGMTGSDIIIGGVLSNGQFYFQDRYAQTNGMPIIDSHQDWTLLSSSENNSFTYLKFSRPLITCDSQDVPIMGNSQRFIWAFGQDDDIKYHKSVRGSFVVNILDPPIPYIDLSQYPSFEAVMDIKMPPRDTSYWCSLHRSPLFTTKQHTVAFGPKILDPVAKKHSHHLSFYQCTTPKGRSAEEFFEPFIIPGGQDCFDGTADRALEIYHHCTYFIYSWAIGAKVMHMPKGVGFPISEGGREYFLLEIHLNNPEALSNISFKSGVEIYHTNILRPIEAGTIAMGAATDWKLVIPPNSANFKVSAHCPASCTSFIEPEGYTLFNVQLHAHYSARTMRLRHFRDDHELPWIADDQSYDNNFQNNRNIHPIQVFSGDHLTLECGYDNTWVRPPGTVIGGYSTRDEMCASVIYYYPKGQFSICGSENFAFPLMKLMGIKRLDLRSADKINPRILSPPNLRGQRIQEYMDTAVNWTTFLRSAVQNQLTVGPHSTLCLIDGVDPSEPFSRRPPATYPKVVRLYQPVDECLVRKMRTPLRSQLKIRIASNTSIFYAM